MFALSKNLGFTSVSLLAFYAIQPILFPGPTIRVAIQFFISILIAWLIIREVRRLRSANLDCRKIVKYFFYYGVFVVVHSVFVAKAYDQWRYLATVFLPTLLLPAFCLIGASPVYVRAALQAMKVIALPLVIIFLIKGSADKLSNIDFLFYAGFIPFLLIMLSPMKMRWWLFPFLVGVLSIQFDIENRSNILLMSMSFFLFFICLFWFRGVRKIFNSGWLQGAMMSGFRMARMIFLLGPLILALLGFFGVFNIFQYLAGENAITITTSSGRSYSADSRTSIYLDAINNLNANNDWLLGSSATVIYETGLADALEGYESGRLGGSESGFIGLLTFGGLCYVALFFALCLKSSFLAIFKSNNFISKIFGVYVAFYWTFIFIESPLQFNFRWVGLFLIMGMCLGREFRSYTDSQVIGFVRSI